MSQQELLKKVTRVLGQTGIPYMITGLLNQHPRAAIKFNTTDSRGDIVKFFDQMIDEP